MMIAAVPDEALGGAKGLEDVTRIRSFFPETWLWSSITTRYLEAYFVSSMGVCLIPTNQQVFLLNSAWFWIVTTITNTTMNVSKGRLKRLKK